MKNVVVFLETPLRTVPASIRRTRLSLVALGLLAAVSCGGRVIQDQDPGSGSSDPNNAPPASTAQAGPGTGDPLPSKALGDCVPGFDHAQNPERPCRWLTVSGICFDDSDTACACICPKDRDSLCAHGFDDGPNAQKRIRCD